jgi:Domain of unknown function DUF29
MQQRPHIAPAYDEDFFAWTQHQAKLLRGLGKQNSALPQDLDLAHVAEEIRDLGKAELRGATSRIRNIMVHLIKAASVPNADAVGHWRTEVATFHVELADFYVHSMRRRIDLQKLWARARRLAEVTLQEHSGCIGSNVPIKCPFSLHELVADDFDFDDVLARLRRSE